MGDPPKADPWSDLSARVISALVMVVLGALVVGLGGWVFTLAMGLICAVMIWETLRLFGVADRPQTKSLAGLCGICLFMAAWVPAYLALPLLGSSVGLVVLQSQTQRVRLGLFAAWVLFGAWAMLGLRLDAGLVWFLWVICVIIASDVAGWARHLCVD